MGINYTVPEYDVIRDPQRCIACRVCERQCANGVHSYDEGLDVGRDQGSAVSPLYQSPYNFTGKLNQRSPFL